MIAGIIVSVVGIVLAVLGTLIWKKEMISLLHSYHYDKVSSDDKTAFCRMSGIGVLLMGISMIISGVLAAITNSGYSFIIFAICFIAGLVMLITAGAKYNK